MNAPENNKANQTSATSLLDLVLGKANEMFGKQTGSGSKSTSYISLSIKRLLNDKGEPTAPVKFNLIVAEIAIEKSTNELGHEPNMANPEDVEIVTKWLNKSKTGVKQVFGSAPNGNSIKGNSNYNKLYKGVVNADGTVALELLPKS